jgi:hypothetical protein
LERTGDTLSSKNTDSTRELALNTVSGRVSGLAGALWLAAIALGAVGLYFALAREPQRAWQAVWVNFMFWTAIAQAGVIFGAILVAAKGHWGKPFRRVAEATGGFLPISLVVFVTMYWGAGYIFPWMQPIEGHINRDWLTHDGVFLRNGILLLMLYAASFYYLRLSLRPDAPLAADRQTGWRKRYLEGVARGWRGDEQESARSRRILAWLAPVLILAWVLVFSLLATDMTMSLMPGFISVIWGPLFFVAGLLCLLSLVAVIAQRYKGRYHLADVWGKWEFHDLGKLMFAFVIFWSYLWFSQYLPIWYGNLGRETIFFEQRLDNGFGLLLYVQMALIFAIPFALLLWRVPKMSSRHLSFVGLIILVGFWLERYMSVVPSTWHGESPPLGWVEAVISVGFLGLFGISYSLYASLVPKIPSHEALITGEKTHGP